MRYYFRVKVRYESVQITNESVNKQRQPALIHIHGVTKPSLGERDSASEHSPITVIRRGLLGAASDWGN